jgi:tRNA G10  N-methylase Trm11
MHYIFELGHQPHISSQEIISLLKKRDFSFRIESTQGKFFEIESHEELPSYELLHELGGSISLAKRLPNQKEGIDTIASSLIEHQQGKIQFCIQTKNTKLGLNIKKKLKELGRSVRYIDFKNTATIFHNNLIEKKGYFIEYNNNFYIVEGIQDLEKFSTRDFKKPGFDTQSGMLPPKLARIMINLAEKEAKTSTFLDPFCGSGVALLEAYNLGYNHIIGTDISSRAIDDTNKNIEWIQKQDKNDAVKKIEANIADIKDISEYISEKSIDLIVAEPYMGKPLRGNESQRFLDAQIKELEHLYTISFVAFSKILKEDGTIIFLVPQFMHKEQWIKTSIKEALLKSGLHIVPFSEKESTLLYHRAKQHVGRLIVKLKK